MASSGPTWRIGFGYDPKGFSIVKRFDDEYNGNSDLGDLFTVKCGTSYKPIYHVGVCCDEDEIIHFTQSNSRSSGSVSSSSGTLSNRCNSSTSTSSYSSSSSSSPASSSCPGLVSKVNVNAFSGGLKFAIYRKNGGIPPSFRENVKNAMRKNPQYDLFTYNCIHFAMELLGVEGKEEDP